MLARSAMMSPVVSDFANCMMNLPGQGSLLLDAVGILLVKGLPLRLNLVLGSIPESMNLIAQFGATIPLSWRPMGSMC